jgi:hypothetical protein
VVALPKRQLNSDKHPEPATRPQLLLPSKHGGLPAVQYGQEGVQPAGEEDRTTLGGLLTDRIQRRRLLWAGGWEPIGILYLMVIGGSVIVVVDWRGLCGKSLVGQVMVNEQARGFVGSVELGLNEWVVPHLGPF